MKRVERLRDDHGTLSVYHRVLQNITGSTRAPLTPLKRIGGGKEQIEVRIKANDTELETIEKALCRLEGTVKDGTYLSTIAKPGWLFDETKGALGYLDRIRKRLGLQMDDNAFRWFQAAQTELQNAQREMPGDNRYNRPYPPTAPLPLLASQAGELARRRDALKADNASLEEALHELMSTISEKVKRAIKAGDGLEKVVECIIGAQRLLRRMPSSLATLIAADEQAEAEHSQAEHRLEMAIREGIPGMAIETVREAEAKALAKFTKAREELYAEHKRSATAFVASVEAGDQRRWEDLVRLVDEAGDGMFLPRFRGALAAAEPRTVIVDQALAVFTK
jgi:hypothetical protein